jgi:endoglucanase
MFMVPWMKQQRPNGATGLAALLSALVLATVTSAAPPGPMPFGVYDPEGTFINDTEVSIEHVCLPWEDVNLNSLLEADAYALERNRALLITVEPWTWTRDERHTPQFLREGIAQGSYDARMRGVCSVVATLQSPVSIRWAHEMEDTDGQFIWANWRPRDYISAYRRMTDICRAEAPAINLVWSPLGLPDASEYYPGDDYVNLVGLSVFGYEPWENAILGGAQTYADILDKRYDEVKEFNKPVFVAELGYSGSQEYVNRWESDVRRARPDLPLLVGVAYFNQAEVYPWPDGFGFPDWRIENRVIE